MKREVAIIRRKYSRSRIFCACAILAEIRQLVARRVLILTETDGLTVLSRGENWPSVPRLSERDITSVIPPRKNRKHPADYDKEMYKWRYLAENFFQKIKNNRDIETRYCNTDTSFSAFIPTAATIL